MTGLHEQIVTSIRGHMPVCPNPGCPKYAGPLYCQPCSDAINDWVQWTPEHAASHISSNAQAVAVEELADRWTDMLSDPDIIMSAAQRGAWRIAFEELNSALSRPTQTQAQKDKQ